MTREVLPFELIALDVDGTLLTDDHELTEGTRQAVREAGLRGAEIMVCTGRGPGGAFQIMDKLGLQGIVITHNGAATIDADDKRIVHQYEFTLEQATRYMNYCWEQGVHFDLNTAFDLYLFNELDQEGLDMYAKYGIVPIVIEKDQIPTGLVKMTVFADPKTLDKVEAEWRTWETELQIIRSGEYFIDIQHPSANKGSALEQYAKQQNIPRERVMAIGNYYNDIGMLHFAGLGVAMDNSPEDVKEAADEHTLSNAEDGVMHALNKFVLNV
ncbi:HAD family phosphatase [Paenibacillus sp. PR3]|uniref:HAD family phosphatase n=1 Tax=Paenibacillus terricola TaxID=2763503 RepID=A0ABR8MWU9_9BACL|nr:Cof-type HAD-IIB family hydrolase [Paenibacillus terricola]MBD3919521.1 HAD family phosphatase [Paenibacillus terricola]